MRLTPKEAATRAGVSPTLIYQWCEERRLPHYRCGGKGRRGRILIDEEDLETFLQSLRVEEEHPQPKSPPPRVPQAFNNLDSERLLEAWRQQGVLPKED